ncbi:unnamed protein product [Diabrotica balteata]|uniref:HAT C-terminal dimerisation domain-containing protein n=1 Tax=Diabrotica balteata TaxID=107213 RepID=A0A9N9SU37_DIABA|nr:unnamed protein product [Diabrotica balteata]
MSVVQNIIFLKNAGKLTYEELLHFKTGGRPKPKMTIKQTSLDKNREVNRYFSNSMYDIAEWICGCEERNAFFCFPCLLFGDDYLWSKTGVIDLKHLKIKTQKHSLLSDHINSCFSLAMLGSVVIKLLSDSEYNQGFNIYNENVSKNRFVLNKIINCMVFCGAFELALIRSDNNITETSDSQGILQGLVNFVSELDVIFKENFKNSSIFEDSSNVIKNELLKSILTVVHDEIRSEILQAEFVAIQADTIIGSNNMTAIIFRYVKDGVICERFWKCIESGGTAPQDRSELILRELEDIIIDKHREKLVGQSYDAASVTSGGMGGVHAKIKQFYPSAHFIHSYAHQLHLILQKAASQDKTIKVFFANLYSFSSFFGKSQERTTILDEIIKVRFVQGVPTCWDFNTKVLETVYTYKNELIECIEKIIDSETNYSSINQAISLRNYLDDEIFLYWLNFFRAVMAHCDVLFDLLQKRDIDIITLDRCMMDFRSKIQAIKCNIMTSFTFKPGEVTEHSSKRRKIEDSTRRISLEVCNIIICEIEYRFGRSNYLIISQLFYSDKFINYRENFPENIFKLVKTEYPLINYVKLKTELEVMYSRQDFTNCEGANAYLQFFINQNLCDTFSESVKLLKILCTIPMTTIETGRYFSTSQRIRTFFRNTLSQERMCAWAMLSIEKHLIKNIKDFNEKVIDHLASQNSSEIDLVYKTR